MVITSIALGGGRGCSEHSQALGYVRSLSQERLEQLYTDIVRYADKDVESLPGGIHTDTEDVAIEFQDLLVESIQPTHGQITVEGCFDHYVYLYFDGIRKSNNGAPAIRVTYGKDEDAKEETIWPK
ncbi:MAG: hypothetical protein ACI93R_003767 [Flavobacteriales bacterium]|jgi:hypothetical protein